MTEAREKMDILRRRLAEAGRLALAFSGGVDSVFLLAAAREVRPAESLLALTARGAFFPARETAEAAELARSLGVPQAELDFDPLSIPEVAANSPERCYFCKRALFGLLAEEARKRGFPILADGGNADDLGDYRPGLKAVRELGVLSPLQAAGLTKAEIRSLSAEMNLPTWDKPAWACLASRVVYGQSLDRATLERVERAEDFLLAQGFREVRVRVHGRLARLEVGPDQRDRFFNVQFMDRVSQKLLDLGFSFAALDLAGYQRGNLNRDLPG